MYTHTLSLSLTHTHTHTHTHTMACLDERDLGVHFNAQERAVRSDEPPRTLQNLLVGLAV